MKVNLKEEVKFLKEQLVLKELFREEIAFLHNKLGIALSNQVNKSHTLTLSQDSSSIEYKEDDNTISDLHQKDQMNTVINATPDICDQTKVTVSTNREKQRKESKSRRF